MAANDYIRARIDPELKADAAAVLESLGLTISDVMRMTLTRIARDKALPVELTRPNDETLAAIEEARGLKKGHGPHYENIDDMIATIEKA
ncbi:DNA-damage-inducible protein J [Breoghania corrubedonensis]|uniref:DNA-damage-inducible protein J n=1 Tax=Breoghania corrubedonensis TaxID=665038 RepID=A0A2T5VF45_9HYPH|nr:type II toxin-antitoxin system RelB/DinJ family antitoxin [Breoghania corrubedonensis]PTW62372.1 DNA-damage-inducible protein J [Breoghania corrubedonensis]